MPSWEVWLVMGVVIQLGAAALKEASAAAERCPGTERAALLHFYTNAFQGPHVPSYTNASADCCEWPGVGCDGGGSVVSLLLDGYDTLMIAFNASLLSVPWPLPLAGLSSLKELQLDGFEFGIPLPPEIGLLSHSLTTLSLRQSNVLPPLPAPALANLTRLTRLDLSDQGRSGSSAYLRGLANLNIRLDLSDLGSGAYLFSGYQIPPELCNSTALQELSLSNNGFAGTIPSCLSLLPHLTHLDLSKNQLTGPIPGHWNATSSLAYLDLSINYDLTGHIYPGLLGENMGFLSLVFNSLTGSIPPIIGKLPALQRLLLDYNGLTGSIPASVGNLTQLLTLSMSKNELSGPVPDQLGNLLNIGVLDLSDNRLSGGIPAPLVAGLGANSSSRGVRVSLDLSSNELAGDLPWPLLLMSRIVVLNLASNNLTSAHIQTTLALLNYNSSTILEELDLSSNNITGPIPLWLSCLPALTVLRLSSNNLVISSTDSLVASNLTNLQNLDLSSNSLTGPIPSWISHFTALRFLDLSLNHLKGSIPPWLWLLPQLTSIDLSMNNISGDIPLTGGLCGLRRDGYSFNASHNHLNRILNESLASSDNNYSSNCSFYESVLDLHSNYLFGVIPWEAFLAGTYGFVILNLANNSFFGGLPEDWRTGEKSYLELDLSHNHLSGKIPASIYSLYFISLDLSSNNFSGGIPSSLICSSSGSPSLASWMERRLKLDSNSLTGSIPDALGGCEDLVSLVLRDNLLTGPLPHGLSNLSANLRVLDLSGNILAGGIPPWIQQMPSLRVLNLSSNGLSGPLPRTTWNTTQLQVLDLSYNDLRGIIPAQSLSLLQGFLYSSIRRTQRNRSTVLYDESITIQAKGTELKYTYLLTATVSLDLSNNALVGPIPPELGSLDGLVFLNLSNNSLTGQLPDKLSNLTQLSSLDVSKNDLVGEIPETFCALTFLSFVDVSDNKLSGPIPQCNQFTTFTRQAFLRNKGLCGRPLASCPSSNISNHPSPAPVNHDAELPFLAILVGFGTAFPTCLAIAMLWRPVSHPISKLSGWIVGKIVGGVD